MEQEIILCEYEEQREGQVDAWIQEALGPWAGPGEAPPHPVKNEVTWAGRTGGFLCTPVSHGLSPPHTQTQIMHLSNLPYLVYMSSFCYDKIFKSGILGWSKFLQIYSTFYKIRIKEKHGFRRLQKKKKKL